MVINFVSSKASRCLEIPWRDISNLCTIINLAHNSYKVCPLLDESSTRICLRVGSARALKRTSISTRGLYATFKLHVKAKINRHLAGLSALASNWDYPGTSLPVHTSPGGSLRWSLAHLIPLPGSGCGRCIRHLSRREPPECIRRQNHLRRHMPLHIRYLLAHRRTGRHWNSPWWSRKSTDWCH